MKFIFSRRVDLKSETLGKTEFLHQELSRIFPTFRNMYFKDY